MQSMAPTLGWGVERRRWLQCALWQVAVSSIIWVLRESLFTTEAVGNRYLRGFVLVPSLWTCCRCLIFQAAQLLFLLGEWLITVPQEKELASLSDVLTGVLKLAWKAVVGSPLGGDGARLVEKIRATRDHLLFAFLCGISGFMSLFALTSSVHPKLEDAGPYDFGLRGVAVGLFYAFLHVYEKKSTLSFPIIQRRFFFSLKMGIPRAVKMGVKVAMAVIPIAEISVSVCHAKLGHSIGSIILSQLSSWMWHQVVFVAGAFCTIVCWELCHHLIQVRDIEKLSRGNKNISYAIVTSDFLGMLLLFVVTLSWVLWATNACAWKHLVSSEGNVDTWRRAAFFEETGETYKRVIGACLRPLDDLTFRLAKGLETYESEKAGDSLKKQMQLPGGDEGSGSQGGTSKEIFRDFQLCAWCARSAACLTARSRTEDRYGVAQLSGCNVAVLSSLLSCLLVVEVYLGRRSASRGAGLAGPNSIKWTMPSRGAYMDVGQRRGFPFAKRTVMHKKAYAMADVLRISIYQIVSAFGEVMVVGSVGLKGFAIAERDWISQKKTLYGTHDMHLQKLETFLDYRVG